MPPTVGTMAEAVAGGRKLAVVRASGIAAES